MLKKYNKIELKETNEQSKTKGKRATTTPNNVHVQKGAGRSISLFNPTPFPLSSINRLQKYLLAITLYVMCNFFFFIYIHIYVSIYPYIRIYTHTHIYTFSITPLTPQGYTTYKKNIYIYIYTYPYQHTRAPAHT